nr:unnamed protein product [Callosobruchus analis]
MLGRYRIEMTDDPELSDDEHHNENNNPPHHSYILAYGSDGSEPEGNHNNDAIIPENNVESGDSDDDMPLQEIAEKMNPGAWRTGYLIKDSKEIEFTENLDMPKEVADLETPLQFFKFFFTKEIISAITTESNLYCPQKRINRPVNITEDEIVLEYVYHHTATSSQELLASAFR